MEDKKDSPKPKRLKINPEKCIKCGTCVATYGDIFEFAEDGSVRVKKDAKFEGKDLNEIKRVCAAEAIEEE